MVFQPAEETGEGAARINKGLKELDIHLDYLFGLHNIVGYPKGQILTKKGTFAAASRGMVIKLFGKTSHAAEPEYGISPVTAIAEITTQMSVIHITNPFSEFNLGYSYPFTIRRNCIWYFSWLWRSQDNPKSHER